MQLDSALSRSPCCLKTTCVPELEKSGVSATGASWISKSWLLKFRPWPVSLFSSGMYFCNKSGTSSTCPNTISNQKMQSWRVHSLLFPAVTASPPSLQTWRGRVSSVSRKVIKSIDNFFMLIIERCPERWEKKARETMKCQLLQTNGFHPTNTHSYMQTLISRIQLYIKYINLP